MIRGYKRLKYIFLFLIATCLYAQSGARYLIITPDAYLTTLQPLVEWKYKKGMKPAVYSLSQVGYDSVSIKNFIVNCYNSWEIKPEFIVLVGHPGNIPMCYYNYGGYWYYTDNYYANMDGDVYNEIIPGRLSVSSTTELQTVINKVLQYERTPLTADPSWFSRGTAMANCDGQDDSTYLYCMRYAHNIAVVNGFSQVDTFCNYYGNNASQVVNAINQGRIFVNYRGNANNHWYNPFDVNPYSTSNGAKLPIILSTTCRTVSSGSTPILGENFLRVGTASTPRGAVGFIGGTRNTGNAAHLRNAVAIGCLDAMFEDQVLTFGEIAEGGRLRVIQQYGEVREYNNFTCLGDPELNVWTAVPCSLMVEHPVFIPLSVANFVVHVSDTTGDNAVSGAFVCVAGKNDSSIYVLDTTDANGDVTFNLTPQVLGDTIYVTVTGKNLRPYEGGMEVRLLDYAFLRYKSSLITDTTGNNDGKINPTEVINMPLWVENIGESTGVQIQGVLRTNDPYVSVSDSVKDFGDVASHDSAFTGQAGYIFNVLYDCPNSHAIDFELEMRDTNDSVWISQFSEIVFAPDMFFDKVRVEGGNGNGVVDPGETLNVFVSLGNSGGVAADTVEGMLRFDQAGVVRLDSTAWFGHIGIDSIVENTGDPFAIYVDTSVTIGTVIDMNIDVTSNYTSDIFDFSLVVGYKHYYLWNPDPSPSSGEYIHSELGNLGYMGDYGTSLPASLAQYRALLVCLGVYSNRHRILQGSADAVMITDFLNSGGRVYMEGSSAWYVDPQYFSGHDFGPWFGISGITWSHADLGPITGQSSTFTNGMYFNYTGENGYMDHIAATGGGFNIFRDVDNSYYCGVARDAGAYKTVGLAFELAGLADGTPPSTRSALIDSIMKFLGVVGPGVEEEGEYSIHPGTFGVTALYPNPFNSVVRIAYCVGSNLQDTRLEIYDITGRLVRSIRPTLDAIHGSLVDWDGRDDQNRLLPCGVYFVYLSNATHKDVKKIIKLK